MAHVIFVAGAGGKTAYIERLAERLAADNLRVCVTTTTHIYRQDDRQNISFAGTESGGGKLSYPGGEVFRKLCREFDAVLFLAGDMLNFAGGDILRLVLEFLCSGKICGCTYSDHPSNPGIFLRECHEDLLKLS